MNWLSQNWVWIVLGIGVLLLLRRTGCIGGMGHGQHGHDEGGGDHANRSSPPSNVISAIDPVTGKDVSTARATTSVYHGRVYYFETPESRQRFEASPAQYAREGTGQALPNKDTNRPGNRQHGGC